MKRKYIINLIALILIIILDSAFRFYQTNQLNCDYKQLKNELKKYLKPDYKYDTSKLTKFSFKNKEYIKEIEIPLFIGEKYRFVFNLKGLAQDIKIEFYNKSKDAKKRKLYYSVNTADVKDDYLIWEPEKSRKMYLDYIIPQTTDTIKKSCVVFLLGYKL